MNELNPAGADDLSGCWIRVDDPDIPIHRIFPLWFLEESLRLQKLVLVSPQKWDDPYEILGDAIAVDTIEGGRIKQRIINQSLPPVFAQCWSKTGESDVLLRAYSRVAKDPHFRRNTCPRDEGVRVRSTPRKILRALRAGAPPNLEGHWFLGAVNYLSGDALRQEIANGIGQYGPDMFEVPSKRARLLLLKRLAFSHEDEMRVIFVQDDPQPARDIIRVPFSPSDVFDEILFDPRLETFERRQRAAVVRDLGYTGEIGESELYQRTFLQIRMPDSSGRRNRR